MVRFKIGAKLKKIFCDKLCWKNLIKLSHHVNKISMGDVLMENADEYFDLCFGILSNSNNTIQCFVRLHFNEARDLN